MVSNSRTTPHADQALTPSAQRDLLHRLVAAASDSINSQLDAFAAKLSAAMLAGSEMATDAKDANSGFNAGKMLGKNSYPFYHVASAALRSALQDAIDAHDPLLRKVAHTVADELTLVPLEEIENRLLLDRAARPQEIEHADALSAVSRRMSALLGLEQLPASENPFRPAVMMAALDRAWREFDPLAESHHLMLLQMNAGVFLDMAPILKAVNQGFVDAGILPDLADRYQIRKSAGKRHSARSAAPDAALTRQLRQLFNGRQAPDRMHAPGSETPSARPAGDAGAQAAAIGFEGGTGAIAPALSAYLADMQRRAPMTPGPMSQAATAPLRGASRLSEIRQQMPRDAMTPADETTVDVMTRIFEAVFRDPDIPPDMKELIGYLQIPVLKAALIDKEFFFEDAHPARRLVSLLTSSSVGWDQSRGRSDPLYQAIRDNVSRVQQFDTKIALFADVVADLEAFLAEEDNRSAGHLAAPITQALKQERLREATRSATSDVALRVATGEVATFVEAFLESRWVPVLTLAHSVKDEKPQVLESAIRTMDQLIWSVQPKITVQQRKELVTKLPSLLTTLNKWLNVLKWEDADRLQFFADLAECHASIVRAPLELSPHRQLEIAVEAAKKAAERRLEKRAAATPEIEPEPDAGQRQVESLQRGMWFTFRQPDADPRKVKLAWVSPLKSLYIFTTVHREEAFSLSTDVLAQNFRDGIVRIVDVDSFVDRALADALGDAQSTQAPTIAGQETASA